MLWQYHFTAQEIFQAYATGAYHKRAASFSTLISRRLGKQLMQVVYDMQ